MTNAGRKWSLEAADSKSCIIGSPIFFSVVFMKYIIKIPSFQLLVLSLRCPVSHINPQTLWCGHVIHLKQSWVHLFLFLFHFSCLAHPCWFYLFLNMWNINMVPKVRTRQKCTLRDVSLFHISSSLFPYPYFLPCYCPSTVGNQSLVSSFISCFFLHK